MPNLLSRVRAAIADRYTIEHEVGSGGMATVYLAEDVRHHRKVAVKVLRPELATVLGPDRFLREIEVAAQLQHPNILPLLDSGEADGFLYYVMPYVDGPSLRERLANQGELPIHDAMKILAEVVDALAEAHERGIVHRDVKPDNVLLTGRHAVVTDFGVAKAVNEATGRQQLTTAGVALGTPAYMAPEQAAADPNIDRRVDLYAVGAVAYEMLTGRPPFTGPTSQAVLAAHMNEEPRRLRQHRPSIPAALEEIVLKCLAKHPADRWQSAEELLPLLEPFKTPSGGVTPADTRPVRATVAALPRRRVAIGAGVLAIAVVGVVVLLQGGGLPPVEFGQTRQITLEEGLELDPALSPDGRMVAYSAGNTLDMRIYVRSVSGGNPVQISRDLQGEHRMPRWSPDGAQVLFHAPGGVYVAPSLGGTARLVVPNATDGASQYATWSPDGREIAYVHRGESAIYVRPVTGGEPRKVADGLDMHSLSWSPDGALIAYVSGNYQYAYGITVLGNLGPSAVFVVPARGGEPVQLTDRTQLHMSPTWSPDGRSLFLVSTRGGGRDIYRIPIARGGRAAGEMERLTTGLNAGTVALAPDGTRLAYSVFTNTANVWRIRIPASGSVSVRNAQPVTTGTQHIEGLDVTRDGRWLVFDSDRGGNVDIYKMRLPDGDPIQLTTDPHDDFIPQWSPDGQAIAFHSWRHGNRDVFVISADGSGERRLTDAPEHDFYVSWSHDGRRITFHSPRSGGNGVYVVERSDAGDWSRSSELIASGQDARWSPTDERLLWWGPGGVHRMLVITGQDRVLIPSPFMHAGVRHVIQSSSLLWAPDGRTIYFKTIAPEGGAFFSVPAEGGTPRQLVRFDDPMRPSGRGESATDGTYLYFTIDNRQADVWVVDVDVGS